MQESNFHNIHLLRHPGTDQEREKKVKEVVNKITDEKRLAKT